MSVAKNLRVVYGEKRLFKIDETESLGVHNRNWDCKGILRMFRTETEKFKNSREREKQELVIIYYEQEKPICQKSKIQDW